MEQGIRVSVISSDPVSSAVLSRVIKEWPCMDVHCRTFTSVKDAMQTNWLDESDVVFVGDLTNDQDLVQSVKAIRGRAPTPVCYVVSGRVGEEGLAAALRAGARDYINRYVIDEDDVHRCLWSVLRAQNLAMRRMAAGAR